MPARFFHCGLTDQELMKRAFRIKPLAPNIPHNIVVPDDLRQQFTKMHFTQPTDLELGTLADRPILKEEAKMLTAVCTETVILHARGDGFMPVISELLAAVPLYHHPDISAFSVEPDQQQPLEPDGRQRARVTYYTGALPDKIRNEYIIHDGRAYSPTRQMMEQLNRIPVMKPLKLKSHKIPKP